MLTGVSNFTTYICFIIILILRSSSSSNSTFPSVNLSMFTKEDGTTINNEDRKEF